MINVFRQNKKNFLIIIIIAGILSVGISYATTFTDTVIINPGPLGIGTASPGAQLDVQGSNRYLVNLGGTQTATDGFTQSAVVAAPTFSPTSSTTDVADLNFYGNFYPGAGVTITNGYGILVRGAQGGTGTVTNGYGIYVANPGYGTNRYAAYFGGNVGIGTATPAVRLDVEGGQTLLQSNSVSQASLVVNQQGTSAIAIFQQNGGTKVTLDNAGNVGIGTSNPAQKLEVNGWIQDDGNLTTSATNKEFKITAPTNVPICIGSGC